MTGAPEPTPGARRPPLLTACEDTDPGTEEQGDGGAGCWGQLRSRQPACLSQPLTPTSTQCQRLRVFVFLVGGGVRLGALSDELSDNEFEPHGARA